MNAISTFTFHQDHNVRVQMINGEPYFCLRDVCSVLDLNARSSKSFGLDEKGMQKFCTPSKGGEQVLNYVNEPNLYRVIFRSNKPEAKQFQDWVFNEVLPTIRKTGRYEAPKPVEKRNYINNNDMNNLKRLVWQCAGYLDQERSFTNAVYHSLRHVTGVPSPMKFEVEHLPVMAQEFQRILSIIEPYIEMRRNCEEILIKRLLLNRGNAQPILSKLLTDMKNAASNQDSEFQKRLPFVFNDDCLSLIHRKPSGGNTYVSFEEHH